MGGKKANHGVAPPRINDSDGEQELVIMAAESVVPQMTSAEFQRWKQQKVCVQSYIHTYVQTQFSWQFPERNSSSSCTDVFHLRHMRHFFF